MAKEVIIELKAKTDKIEQDVEGINKEIKTLNKNVDKTAEGFEGVEKASQDTAKGVKKIGTTLKAIGIGLLLAAFTKLKEVFEENQKVVDGFNTTFEFFDNRAAIEIPAIPPPITNASYINFSEPYSLV